SQKEHAYYEGAYFDSRDIVQGSIFVALDGDQSHGAHYIGQAIDRGAVCIVIDESAQQLAEEQLKDRDNVDIIYVRDALKAFGDIGKCVRMKYQGAVVGVIGSVGKTTTKNILRELSSTPLAKAYASEKSYNNETGVPLTLAGINENAPRVIVELG